MALNMKSLTQALAKTAAVIEKTVQTTVQEVTGPKALQDYELFDQLGSGGPALAWKLYSARPRNKNSPSQYSQVCVWLLDKRALSESRQKAGLSKSAEDMFLDLLRIDAAKLVRLRHPGVVHVVQGLDESKMAMAFVTEPIFASLANAMGNLDNIVTVPKDLKGLIMGELEIKHGLLQLAESLGFLHNNARLIHRAISPETIFITSSGAWKLGCFGYAMSSDQGVGEASAIQNFHYPEYDVDDVLLPLQPSLNYTAPELVRNDMANVSYASDIFSLGCLIFHLLTRRPLLDCHNNTRTYTSKMAYLVHENFSEISPELVHILRQMLSTNEASRPSALDFTGSPYFRNDTRLRALRFLDHLLERDNMQKSEFLKALSEMWKDFDSRVLRYKVLPPLCAELRNAVMQPMILPMVLTIAESQDKGDFELSTLPALIPVLSSATGETLLLLVKHAGLIIHKASQEYLIEHILPLFIRAYDDPDVRIQEEVLRQTVALAKQLEFQAMKQAILPRVHGLALKTTVAAVRVNALICLGDMVHWLDKQAVLVILQTLQRCTAVDHSASTLMSTLGVANSIYKQYGLEFSVEHLLPLLIPLLTAQQLNIQQFAKYMLFVKEILRKMEEKRGVSLNESGVTTDINSTPGTNGSHIDNLKPVVVCEASGVKPNSSWDTEDWGPIAKGSGSNNNWQVPGVKDKSSSNSTIKEPQLSSLNSGLPYSGPTSSSVTCAPVDILWPSPALSQAPISSVSQTVTSFNEFGTWPSSTSQSLHEASSKASSSIDLSNATGSTSTKDDPFADWPPRTASMNSAPNNGSMSYVTTEDDPFADWPPRTTAMNNAPINGSINRTGNPMNAGMQTLTNKGGWTNSNSTIQNGIIQPPASTKQLDMSMMFASKPEPAALKIAPPPPGGISRGRGRGGRGRGRETQVRSSNSNSSGTQPPLMDLL